MRNAGTTTRTTHLQGINFPFQQDAVDALNSLAQKKLTYVKLVSWLCNIGIKHLYMYIIGTEHQAGGDHIRTN